MSEENEYVPAEQAIELLGEKPSKFYYHADRGDIRTETPAKPGKGKKNNKYLVSDILKLKKRLVEQRQKRKPEPLIDWMYAKDLAAGVKLAQALYDDSVDLAEMAVYQSWRKNNDHLTLAAFNADRSEAYASIQVVPLPEQVILDVLSGKRAENSIKPDEIRSYDEPGEYTLLGTSAIVLKDRPELLLKLLRRYIEFWIDMYPQRYITRIYAQAVSESGDRLASSLFMAPRYDLQGEYPAYMLDLARPGRSKIIRWFQDQLREKALLPEELKHPYVPQPIVSTSPAPAVALPQPEEEAKQKPQVDVVSSAVRSLASTSTTENTTLPAGYRGFTEFFEAHNIPGTTADRAAKAGAFQILRDGWKVDGKSVKKVLDPDGQRAFIEHFRAWSGYHQCEIEGCPCHQI